MLSERTGGDRIEALAIDASGLIWAVGATGATGTIAPTPDALQPTPRGGGDGILLHMQPDGTVVYATYLGGSGFDEPHAIALDAQGNVYVVGQTQSTDYPTTPNAYDRLCGVDGTCHETYGGTTTAADDAFVTKLDPTGRTILYSTYLGGTGWDEAYGVAVDGAGIAHVTGRTLRPNGFATPPGNACATQADYESGAFYARLSADGSSLLFSTCLATAHGTGVAVDASGNAYVGGTATSSRFPLVNSMAAFPTASGDEPFVAKFDRSASIVYSTLVGGVSGSANALALSGTSVYLAGSGCSQNASSGGTSSACGAFVTRLRPDGSAVVGTAVLGGSSSAAAASLYVDANEVAYVAGYTDSTDFPATQDAAQITSGGPTDAFFARIPMDAASTLPRYVTYLGGTSNDWGYAVAGDGAGGGWVGGMSVSANFPRVNAKTSSSDSAFVAHYAVTGATAPASDDIVLYAKQASPIVGNWQLVSDSTAAGGERIWNPDAGAPKVSTPYTAPANYFELTFQAQAGVPYHLWLRMLAQNDSWANDSVYVQFSDSVDQFGNPSWQIGTASATVVSLEDCVGCGEQGWGWNDNGYGTFGQNVIFATSGTHTLRVQQREDGVSIDQIVLSSRTWINSAPGANKNDTTIVSQTTTPPPPPPSNQPPAVSITSPANGATLAQSSWPPIAASASDADGTIAKVDFYANSTLLWTSTTAPYHFTWESQPAPGTYTLTAVATDNNGATTTSSPVSITITASGGAGLPPFFVDSDVGDVGAAGSATYANGTYTVQGSGADVWGTADAFNYASESLSGDGAILARVATVSGEASWVKAGVMMRESPSPDAAQAFMLVSHAKGVCFQRRVSDANTTVSTCDSTGTAPRWVKLVRAGNVITGYQSTDGTTWTVVGSDTFTMLNGIYAGLAVSSHIKGTLSTATFDTVSVIDAVGPNRPPTVSLTSPSNGATFTAPATIQITANATDDTAIAKVDFYANSTLIGAAAGNAQVSLYSFTWSNVAAGTYTLTAIATDDQGATTTSAPVSITVSDAPAQSQQCSSLTLSQTSFYSGGPSSTWQIAVTAPSATCTWTASIDQPWLLLNGMTGPAMISGTGSGQVTLSTTDNHTGAFRDGTFTIGGTPYKVTQEPY